MKCSHGDIVERVMRRSERRGQCLIFTGKPNNKGYGRISLGSRAAGTAYVHRVVATHHLGPPPPDKPCVLHSCDTPLCVEITHLRYGTVAENNAEMFARNRQGGQFDGSTRRVLSDADVADIRASYTGAWGEQSRLAERYGVNRGTITQILKGQRR